MNNHLSDLFLAFLLQAVNGFSSFLRIVPLTSRSVYFCLSLHFSTYYSTTTYNGNVIITRSDSSIIIALQCFDIPYAHHVAHPAIYSSFPFSPTSCC